jgi:pentose-5-phosphate-3-epimerase
LDNIARCAAQGANVFIAGTALYEAADMTAEIELMRQRASDALIL